MFATISGTARAMAVAVAVAGPSVAALLLAAAPSAAAEGGDTPQQPITHITAPESQRPDAPGTDSWIYGVTHGGIQGSQPVITGVPGPRHNIYGSGGGFGGGLGGGW